MKKIHYTLLFAVLTALAGTVYASETSDLFVDRVPKMASENQDERKNAQQDWQNHCLQKGNNAAVRDEINKLTLEQLSKDNPVETSVWLIRQLGVTGDASVVEVLSKLLASDEIRIRDEAARVLGTIPSKEAEDSLKKSVSALTKSVLGDRALDRNMVKATGSETVMPLAMPYSSEKIVADWMKNYANLDETEKAQALANVTVRGDKEYLPLALEAMNSENETLRNAAIFTVAAIGSRPDAGKLLKLAFEERTREQAKQGIVRMNGDDIDTALLKSLEREKDNGRFEIIADILQQRFCRPSLDIVLTRAKQADCPNRLALTQIIEPFASIDNLADLITIWQMLTDRGQRDQEEQLIARLLDGDASPLLPLRNDNNYVAFFSLIGRIGDEKSLEEIRARVFNKPLPAGMTVSKPLSAAALRAMCNWPDGKVIEDLLTVAKDKNFSDSERISALRGFIRVSSLPWDRIKIYLEDKNKVEYMKQGMELATRLEEKKLVLQRSGHIRCPESLAFIMKYIDDKELQEQACQSIIELAHHTWLRDLAKEEFKAALDKVSAVSKDQGLLDRAKRYKDAIKD